MSRGRARSRLLWSLVAGAVGALVAPALPPAPGIVAPAPASAARLMGDDPLDDILYWADQNKKCGLTRDKLAAIMLAPIFPETGSGTTVAPSPMTLSRYDTQTALYSFGSTTQSPNAFWHPGIGMWQFDEAGGWGVTAAERINVYSAAALAAQVMSDRWCANPSLTWVWAPWFGCGTSTCTTIYNEIYDGTKLRSVTRDATVSSLGGMRNRTCALVGRAGSFPCAFVDPALAEGNDAWADPEWGRAPISAPFYVYELDGKEIRHWMTADSGYASPITASLTLGLNSRSNLTWSTGGYLCDLSTQKGYCDPMPPPKMRLRIASVSGVYIPVRGDFNGDGRGDLFWYRPGADPDAVWLGKAEGGFTSVAITISGSYLPIAGDYDGDAHDDILWYGAGSAPDYLWLGGAGGTFTKVAKTINGTYQLVPGDFDGDGIDDLFLYAPGTAADYLWLGRGDGGFSPLAKTVDGVYTILHGDFDGNDSEDLFLYQPGFGDDYVLWGSGNGNFVTAPTTVHGHYLPIVGDFNGTGRDDVLWYRPGEMDDPLWYGKDDRSFYEVKKSITGTYMSAIGDLTNDGRTDIVFHQPGVVGDYLFAGGSLGNFAVSALEVDGAFAPLIADYDGVSGEDVFWYRAGPDHDAIWYSEYP